jgi:hypothetical protein
MAWARFTKAFDWPPLSASHVSYLPDMRCSVPRACLRAAVAADRAVAIAAPPKPHAERLRADPYWTPEEAG